MRNCETLLWNRLWSPGRLRAAPAGWPPRRGREGGSSQGSRWRRPRPRPRPHLHTSHMHLAHHQCSRRTGENRVRDRPPGSLHPPPGEGGFQFKALELQPPGCQGSGAGRPCSYNPDYPHSAPEHKRLLQPGEAGAGPPWGRATVSLAGRRPGRAGPLLGREPGLAGKNWSTLNLHRACLTDGTVHSAHIFLIICF